ncbi:MAG: phosphoenolpyruvate--protein phosphotransferase [Vitreimonas sp.]
MTSLIVAAPLQGWAAPLSEVPDPVFADRMMGDGLAIDPVGGVLHAPFDGEIISLPTTGHALVIRSDAGVEMLRHGGLETVALAGEGFIAHVCEGQRVRAGDRLLSFDLDLLAQRAKSLITPVILTNGERFDIVQRTQNRRINVGDALMELRARAQAGNAVAGEGHAHREITLNFAHGLHARPAATVARAAQRFAVEISIGANGKRANAKSPVGLMTLGARKGDRLVIEGHGADAAAAVSAVADAASARDTGLAPAPASPAAQRSEVDGIIRGVCAAPGVAVGVIAKLATQEFEVAEHGRGANYERAALHRARGAAKAHIQSAAGGDERQRAIMAAHAALLDDPELSAAAERLIAQNKSAGFAWRAAIAAQADALRHLGDAYMADRIADLSDIEQQLLAALGGKPQATQPALPEHAVVVAHELLPSQFASLDPRRLAAICTVAGGATSHVALLAQSLGVPALAAAGPRIMDLADGARVILDADAGALRIAPTDADVRTAEAAAAKRKAKAAAALGQAREEGRTADGTRIQVYANLASAGEAANALAQGAEGCGLLRTEFLFMDRAAAPSEEEQHAHYQAIADALQGRPLVIRTLDAGADKPVPYLPAADEANPALGLRGLRASLKQPDMLRAQLAAILRVTPAARILLPMVNDTDEARAVRAMLGELGRADAPLGAMIETPAAAMLADQLAAEVDFLSIGTNDLAQYALAMDRGHPDLAPAIDPLHPAVLRLIARAAEGARAHQRSISVCGAAASDPLAAPLLIGLGVDTLSAAPHAIASVKAQLRRVRVEDCGKAAAHALTLANAADVRRYAAELWSEAQ